MEWVYISDLKDHIGETITIKGWMYNIRSSKKIHFLQLRDGTGRIQGIMEKKKVGDEVFNRIKRLKIESSVVITGQARKDDRAPSGFELDVESLEIISEPDEDYPISKKEHGIEFLMDNRHLWLRSSKQFHVLRIRNEVIKAIRDFYNSRAYILVDTPIFTGAIGEAAGNLFEVKYFDYGNAYLAQTGQLYLEAACMSLGKVYNLGPTFRAEKSKTRRHLTEFWMNEAEVAYYDNEDNMRLQEDFVSFVVQQVLRTAGEDLEAIGRDTSKLEKIEAPFPRMSYDDAIEFLHQNGYDDIQWGDDLGAEHETVISDQFEKPVMVYNYPAKAKAFYMEPHPDRPDVVLCNDMLAPEGYGEIIGASQRIHDYDVLVEKIKENNLPMESYDWYLDLRKYGSVPHSGYGLGVERTVSWISGIKHVREAIPFPRTLNRLKP